MNQFNIMNLLNNSKNSVPAGGNVKMGGMNVNYDIYLILNIQFIAEHPTKSEFQF